ncbi:RcnB family protein [Pseudaminobacter soli (ex Li et al. 2025)]|uniref:Transmembrane signal peptide protein n=1 Tax=Pseudaminobacter soli (ex Li et al. 2025) TaxID=1295366 RepID=A0A2P7S7Z2_9HYPH|nr:RcnB family protein [Mesorhizobium soli]PSJ58594.1 transmembrane signal peptide protein [Mesorhizobium soli]
MKRIALALVAMSVLAAPIAAQAQPGYGNQVEYRHGHKNQHHKPAPKPHWAKGKRLPDWKRQHVVRDYHRYGLQRPARGQEWVRVDNSYILVNMASGIIAGIFAGR